MNIYINLHNCVKCSASAFSPLLAAANCATFELASLLRFSMVLKAVFECDKSAVTIPSSVWAILVPDLRSCASRDWLDRDWRCIGQSMLTVLLSMTAFTVGGIA